MYIHCTDTQELTRQQKCYHQNASNSVGQLDIILVWTTSVICMKKKCSHSVLSCYWFMIIMKITLFSPSWCFLNCINQDIWCRKKKKKPYLYLYFIHKSVKPQEEYYSVKTIRLTSHLLSLTDKCWTSVDTIKEWRYNGGCYAFFLIYSGRQVCGCRHCFTGAWGVFLSKFTVFEAKVPTERIEVRCCSWHLSMPLECSCMSLNASWRKGEKSHYPPY